VNRSRHPGGEKKGPALLRIRPHGLRRRPPPSPHDLLKRDPKTESPRGSSVAEAVRDVVQHGLAISAAGVA